MGVRERLAWVSRQLDRMWSGEARARVVTTQDSPCHTMVRVESALEQMPDDCIAPTTYKVVGITTSSWGAPPHVHIWDPTYKTKDEAKLAIKNRTTFMMHEDLYVLPKVGLEAAVERLVERSS